MLESAAATSGGFADFVRALTFRGGATPTVVALAAGLLGATGGLVGCFAVLRGRSLVTDALGHATLPGIVAAFAVVSWLGFDGRHPAVTMLGAALSALLALALMTFLRDRLGVREDAAIGTTLAGSFGFGIVLLSLVQGLEMQRTSGLDHVLFGQVATARASDLVWLSATAAACLVAVLALRHSLAQVAFDEEHARVSGVSVEFCDLALLVLLFAVTVAALPVVGAVLVVAMIVLPACAARFWSDHLATVLVLATALGALSAHVGSAISFAVSNAPAGAVIVLTAGAAFLFSTFFAPRRGLLARSIRRRRERRERRARGLLGELRERADGIGASGFDAAESRVLAELVRHGAVEFDGARYRSAGGRA